MTGSLRTILALGLALIVAATWRQPAAAQETADYPVLLRDYADLRKLGIAFTGFEEKPRVEPFEHRCYNFGDGGYRLSVSGEVLARFRAKGFTLETMCMGLVGEARFDPETGRRLPTFVVYPTAMLRHHIEKDFLAIEPAKARRFRGRDPESLTIEEIAECCSEGRVISPELPYDLPTCFRNANPYSDCTWRYAIKSGERLSDRSVAKFRDLGRAIEAAMARTLKAKPTGCKPETAGWPCRARDERHDEAGYIWPAHFSMLFLVNETLPLHFAGEKPLPAALLAGQNLSFADVGPTFPRGFGYALYAVGDAGPGLSTGDLRRALGGGRLKSQISLDRQRQLLSRGAAP